MPHRDWIDLLEAFGPLIAAFVAVGVGLMQRHLQKQQLKQDLFEKRYKVYALTQDFAAAALRVGVSGDEAITKFSNGTAHAEFLFDKDVLEFIDSIKNISRALAPVQEADVTGTSSLHHDLKMGMLFAIDRMNAVFRPYLQLNRPRAPWYSRLDAYMERLTDDSEQRLNSRYQKPS